MPRSRPPFLHCQQTRHGRLVWYVRRGHGARIRIRSDYDTAEFWAEYSAALEGGAKPSAKVKPHTLAWAIGLYRASSAWAALAPATRRQRENIYRAVLESAGDMPLAKVTAKTILDGRERRQATPHAANNFLKSMRGLFGWAAGDGRLIAADPTKGVGLLKGANDEIGFHTWTEDEVARFEAKWPTGTRERLAFDLLLYTGLRRGDVVKLGRQHVRDGLLTIRTEKTGEPVTIPVLAPLAASIAASPTGDLAFLVTGSGTPWVKESFGNWFGEACRKAGVPGSAHGLRKIGATRAAENGASERQLMAIFGWSTGKMATHYTHAAEKRRLAIDAAQLLIPTAAQPGNKNALTLLPGEGTRPKKRANTST